MSRHVLVPIDGTDPSLGALEYCFASFPDAALTALYVVGPRHDHRGGVETDPERDGDRVLERAVDLADDRGRELETERRTGKPHTEILSVATEHDVDGIVLGSHGESPVSRPFLGRVSEAVVRRSPVTTTVVPEPATDVRDRKLPGTILIPIDGSEQAEAALAYALETFPEGTHTAVHVISLPFDRSRGDVEGTYLDKIRTAHERVADEILESATAVAADRGVDLETATAYGDPATEIGAYADEHGYDQLVMGIHGRSLTARLLTGSVAERVARRSTRPVTLVRGASSTN
ncbi:universal stress protein [Natronolimnohabitans sp. A-GB9]|uniref:universal stress protein n=1 Tax=Natronolimnohabitans sp. A-GB9 TaxID=3069757 RepID=UPI0027AF856B|nr:universal stress protein [Natronolimnohabitans sp. A-GB9]MDQ2052428.1 universal stress protein [Natronolimnohabitans sp. A-GB9]